MTDVGVCQVWLAAGLAPDVQRALLAHERCGTGRTSVFVWTFILTPRSRGEPLGQRARVLLGNVGQELIEGTHNLGRELTRPLFTFQRHA